MPATFSSPRSPRTTSASRCPWWRSILTSRP